MRRLLLLTLALVYSTSLWADATFLVQEPYGPFGAINPTGHAAIYLSRVCAVTPLVLRRCDPGELGSVISRYYRISGYDWVAVPLVPYLYAVDDFDSIPDKANSEIVTSLRDKSRQKYLLQIAPDPADGRAPKGAWVELVGAAYNRKIYGFQIKTTEAQDDYLIAMLNSRKNKSHFNLFFNNCADFSRRILNLYYPGAVRRNYLGDAGMTTPQQIAKSLVLYGKQHPGVLLSTFFLPQVAGSRGPSHRIKSVSEGFVSSKKYILPLAAFHPWLATSLFAVYMAKGRFNVARCAVKEYGPLDLPVEHARTTLAEKK